MILKVTSLIKFLKKHKKNLIKLKDYVNQNKKMMLIKKISKKVNQINNNKYKKLRNKKKIKNKKFHKNILIKLILKN